jgi:nucleoside-diphosphate-sugar epimerase
VDALVTGSAGFLGRHFVAELERRGWNVNAWDIVDGECALTGFRYIPDSCVNVELVIHCAAVAPHRMAIDGTPLTVGAANLELDAAMFQWAARRNPGRVVYFSSSAAYPVEYQISDRLVETRALTEDDIDLPDHLPGGGTPDGIYGEVKVMGERLARLYRASGGAVTVVRPFSGYGEDQSSVFPFGAFRDRALAREDPFAVWGTGEQIRDWVHVDDVVGAVLAAVDAEVDGPVNIATGVGTSMAELAGMFCAEAGYAPQFQFLHDRPSGVAYRVGDPARLLEFYTPRVTLDEGVKRALTA